MLRFNTTLAVAVSFAGAVALHAQAPQTTTQTTTKASETKTVSFTGCMAAGTAAQSFILNQAMPVGQSSRTVTGTSGTTTTSTTTYALVPAEKVVLTPHVGHKVEVTGELISGEAKTETTTTSPATGTTIKETTKTPMQQFRVTSVKMLAESCTP
jgi:hypothetical protein